MNQPVFEGQQKALHYANDISADDWLTVEHTAFKLLTTGAVPDKGFLAEVSMRNTGDTDVYVSFGYTPAIAGENAAAKAESLKSVAIHLPSGAFQHIELTGMYVDKLTLRVAGGTGKLQTHAVFLVR